MKTEDSGSKAYWMDQAKRLSRRINIAWFLQYFAAPLLVAAVIGAIATLGIRREFPNVAPEWIAAAIFGALVFLAAVVFFIASKRFEKPETALVRIESTKNLNSSLSAAQAGVAPWPQAPTNLSESLNWHIPRTIFPPVAALAILVVGLLIPISAKSTLAPPASRQPQAWSEIDSQLEKLADDAMVDEDYLEEAEKRLSQLKAQEEQEWFSHASLEATDSLKESHQSSLDELQQDLAEAESALEALTDAAGKLDSEQKKKLTEEFEEALEGMQNGAMKPNADLMDKLSKLDPNNLGKLSKEQMDQLKENMEKLQQSLDKAEGEAGENNWEEQLLGEPGDCENGNCQGGNCPNGSCQGKDGEGPGSGGINRGPGHDPNVLRGEKDTLDAGELTSLEAKDLSRAMPGDLLQLQEGKHTVDETASKSAAGGAASAGQGGDRVWKESLAPDEQRALKKYFE